MFISNISINNFRNFKSESIELNEGINVIIGHNNAGKTNLIKALSLIIDSQTPKKLGVDDFNKDVTIAELKNFPPKIKISLIIKKGENEEEDDLATVGNWLTKLDADYEALLTYEFFLPEKYIDIYKTELDEIANDDPKATKKAWKLIKHGFIRLYTHKIWGGNPANQTQADSESLQKFDFQFLDAIRDVERDMLSGRNTLLREVLDFFIDYGIKSSEDSDEDKKLQIKEEQNKFAVKADELIDILQSRMNTGKAEILSYARETGASLNKATPDFDGSISEVELFSALQLIIRHISGIEIPATHNGLGYNNLIYMSLLLAKMQVDSNGNYMGSNAKVFATLAIEEPEAHLHPAMQHKFLKFLDENKAKKKVRQIFVTTHSTHITSAVSLENLICLHNNDVNELSIGYPKTVFETDKSKKYVQRFLDATKSDILFAQKAILVEGIAEQLLLSIFAKYYNHETKAEFDSQQVEGSDESEYKSKVLEDNHVAVINVGGRYFNHFLQLFDSTKPNTLHKRIACLTDNDPTRKNIGATKYKKCYPFEYGQDFVIYEYQDNPTGNLTTYAAHPNIRFFTQDENYGKTFEYDLVRANPSLKLLLTESISNIEELESLMGLMSDDIESGGKSIQDFLELLPKGTVENPNKENVRIEDSINSCNWTDELELKKAIIASRYLNSIGKGENAMELAYVLEENFSKIGTPEYQEFIVPLHIKNLIDWVCQ